MTDTADTADWAGAMPSHLVLLVGNLSNISRADTSTMIATAPHLCSPGAVTDRGS